MNFEDKMNALAALVEKEQLARLKEQKLDVPGNITGCRTIVRQGNKYWKVDVGSSGKLMVEKATGIIYGIKGYGQVHKGHAYGTLDTTSEWFWGNFYPQRK